MTDTKDLPRSEITTLLAIMRALRDADNGCPWDIAQTFETIAPYTIEEAYEVADAIDRNDMDDLRAELGDLLLQVVYHSQMASEQGAFCFEDTVEAINSKMLRRHPHVFGSPQEREKPPKPGFWEEIKDRERNQSEQGILGDVPTALPALTLSVKLQSRAARANFDWPNTTGVFDKITEEIDELRSADRSGDTRAMAEELGDLLFVLANLARHHGIDPEQALRSTCTKFKRRFRYIEQSIEKSNKTMTEQSLEQLDALWDEAKRLERD